MGPAVTELPPLPPGFTLDAPAVAQDNSQSASVDLPPLPAGFTLDKPNMVNSKPNLATDPSLYDKGDEFGKKALRVLREAVRLTGQGLASMAGAPLAPELQPQNASEQYGTALSRGLGMAGAGIGAGRAMLQSASPIAQGVGQILQAAPGSQVAGASAGSVAAEAAKQEGAGEGGQLAASMIGGGIPQAAETVARAGVRGVGAVAGTALMPSRQRAVIAGNILNEAAIDPRRARTNLAAAQEVVPGSAPTSGQASQDPGIAYLENRLRSLDQSRFSTRVSAQNEARNAMLDSIADGGAPRAIQQRIDSRNQITSRLRDQAFAQASGHPADGQAILDTIGTLAALPENRGESVQAALNFARRQLTNADGTPETNVQGIYAARKEINRILEGKYVGSDESVLRNAGGQLMRVKTAIDDAITEVAPDWRRYLQVYSRMSRPIERAESMQQIRQRTDLAAPDPVTGRDFISQPKWKNVVSKNLPELQRTFTAQQIARIRTVSADLDRGAAATSSASVAVPGSATAANMVAAGNMTVAHVVGRVLGRNGQELPTSVAAITKPFSWMLSYNDHRIRELVVEALLDPRIAESLMRRGTPENVARVSDAIQRLAAAEIGATQGALAQGDQPQSTQSQ